MNLSTVTIVLEFKFCYVLQTNSAVVVLAEEAESKSSAEKDAKKAESSSAKNVLHKVQTQVESLQKKISGMSVGVQKYV